MKKKEFQELLTSIDQARKIHSGKIKPARVYRFDPVEVVNIRKKLHKSQTEFAGIIGVSVDTLQNWEQNRRRPEGPALALLKVTACAPEAVIKALHT